MQHRALINTERQNFQQRFLIPVSSGIVVKMDLDCWRNFFFFVSLLLLLTYCFVIFNETKFSWPFFYIIIANTRWTSVLCGIHELAIPSRQAFLNWLGKKAIFLTSEGDGAMLHVPTNVDCLLWSAFIKLYFLKFSSRAISSGNRIEWSPIQFVVILMINKMGWMTV